MAIFEIDLDPISPYVATGIFSKGGKTFFGIWNPPLVRIDGDEAEVIVQEGQEGQLDLFADSEYNDRRLWYVIAQANKIDFPLRDVVPGMRLIIPKIPNVNAALQAFARRAGAQT
jgi:hypothetical protein